MADIADAKTAEVASSRTSVAKTISGKDASIRVSPNNYFIALFLATFFSGLLIFLDIDWAAAVLFISFWILIPLFVWTDRIAFDGKRIRRTGILPTVWSWFNASVFRLKLNEIEHIETQTIRVLKRNGNVFYRYSTAISGKNLRFSFASGGEDYRRMVRQLFPLLSENLLDNRSIELRDYLSEPKETLMKAEFAHIPSVEVLENSFFDPKVTEIKMSKLDAINIEEIEKADYLQRLGNELKLSGYLLQALEAFRRALILNPQNAWLIFESARCLYSFASSERDEKLQKKAIAALRLAEKRAANDSELLSRLGETYFQYGDWQRAQKTFQKTLDIAGESFRAVRGMAEIALREGKIAHVIHHFSTANRLAETPALRRWTQGETDYFSRLNDDEEYMDMEISRINMLETLDNSKKTALRIALLGIPAILLGITVLGDIIANIGWAVSSVSFLIWAGLIMSKKLLSDRIPLDMVDEDQS